METTYAASDDCWPYFNCATCDGEASDTDNTGIMFHGGYGSTRYDTSSLVWIVRGEDVFPHGYICDDCIDRAVSDGKLEKFHTSLGDDETGLNLSAAAYRELFAYGARKAYHTFWSQREDSPYYEERNPAALEEAIKDMRYRLSGDMVVSCSVSMKRIPIGWEAVDIGYAHAVSAITFGCSEADPGFEKAAETWGSARKALDAEMDRCWHSTEEMFEAMMKEADIEPDNGKA
ncbi:hypothetical protein ILP92_17895 [Maribius pontilimi]|uniref:Uncharacterized protein n=1 Tax=Palleronia pontilimi TaxID=1964209 RepID=A0A934IM80_9RHOB|nr:hypothetical protein [Palleronia pontilimi]MBJ3764609.1 hypothetical protein [Palleronia pontilimi]